MKPNAVKKISVVIPIYNEAGNIMPLYEELVSVLSSSRKEYEIIYIDDCSSDASLEILGTLFQKDTHVEVISLLGNHGQTIALSAGFKRVSGDVVIAMDGDGQHDPSYVPQFIQAIEEGYDLASSWKSHDERGNMLHGVLSKVFHKIVGTVTGVKMNYFGSTMKAYRAALLQNLDLSGDLHRFAGALVYYKGIKVKEIPIVIRKREKGTTNYGIRKVFRVVLDLLLIKFLMTYSKAPFLIFGTVGLAGIVFGFIGIGIITYEKYIIGIPSYQNTGLLVVSAIGVIVGIQLLISGFVAELISRVYYASDRKGLYSIKIHLQHR